MKQVLIALSILVLLLVLFSVVNVLLSPPQHVQLSEMLDASLSVEKEDERQLIAPPNNDVQQMLNIHPTFQALVSYTDNGFEPKDVRITAGETIRFVNNASHALSLSDELCERTLVPQAFCMRTFFDIETVEYINEAFTSHQGYIYVE